MSDASHPAGATEGPRGHEARPPTEDRLIPLRVFLAVGAFYAVMGMVYGPLSAEWAGTVMLVVAVLFATWCAAYLWLRQRPRPEEPVARPEPGAAYLPHASVWPFTIGLGAATVLNGLVLGTWVIVPGAALMVLGIGGFVRQTRRRD